MLLSPGTVFNCIREKQSSVTAAESPIEFSVKESVAITDY